MAENTAPKEEVVIKSSFFDDGHVDDGYKMWKKKQPMKKASEVRIMEGILFKRSKRTNFWKSRFYVLYEDRLAYYKNGRETNEQGYCIIQNMTIERVAQKNEKDDKFGIRLIHNKTFVELYARAKDVQEKWITKLTSFCVLRDYDKNYTNIKTIGKGSFAKVYLAKKKSDNTELAVKTFDKSLLHSNDKAKASLINEINIMRKLSHDNIIKLYEIYENDHAIFLIVELLRGGELFERIVKKGQYNEKDTCTLMKKLLSSLNYLHERGIMHRDLKPENLILKDNDNDWDIKIADFGLATHINVSEFLFKRCGTPGYVAPEILADEKYDEKVDIFSAGVILYILLTGGSPFHGKSYNEILWKNKTCDIKFNFNDYGHKISESATDLMKKMLAKDPKQRISAREALQHDWIVGGGSFLSPRSHAPVYLSSAQENMKKFQENRFNVKNIKPKDLDRTLEKSQHAPSPLITGHLSTMYGGDSKNHVGMGSPDVKVGAILMNKHSRFSKNGKPEENKVDDDDKSGISANMMKYQQNGFSFIKKLNDSNKNPFMSNGVGIRGIGKPTTPQNQAQPSDPRQQKKALSAQGNLLSFIKKGTPESPRQQFTLGNFEKKTKTVSNNLKNLI